MGVIHESHYLVMILLVKEFSVVLKMLDFKKEEQLSLKADSITIQFDI
jgi:hypothetical protein